jgi:thioredoxin 1
LGRESNPGGSHLIKGTQEDWEKNQAMSNVLHVQPSDWQALESSAKPVFLDFWAEWCAPCRMLTPAFERLAQNYGKEITFAKVNVDELPDVANKFGVRSIPTLILVQQGNVLERVVGLQPESELVRLLEQHIATALKKQ